MWACGDRASPRGRRRPYPAASCQSCVVVVVWCVSVICVVVCACLVWCERLWRAAATASLACARLQACMAQRCSPREAVLGRCHAERGRSCLEARCIVRGSCGRRRRQLLRRGCVESHILQRSLGLSSCSASQLAKARCSCHKRDLAAAAAHLAGCGLQRRRHVCEGHAHRLHKAVERLCMRVYDDCMMMTFMCVMACVRSLLISLPACMQRNAAAHWEKSAVHRPPSTPFCASRRRQCATAPCGSHTTCALCCQVVLEGGDERYGTNNVLLIVLAHAPPAAPPTLAPVDAVGRLEAAQHLEHRAACAE